MKATATNAPRWRKGRARRKEPTPISVTSSRASPTAKASIRGRPALAEARVISVQMSAPTIAFGGYSWPGVGQYEKITGVAYAEVDPTDRRNAVIVDIGLAQTQAAPGQPGKTPSGKVAYLLNFYILKPVNLNQVDRKLNGYGKMMYEPPNRGGKTWTALGRVGGGGDEPDTTTRPTIIAT